MTARGSSPTPDLDSYCNEYGIPDRERAGLQRLVASLRREAAAQEAESIAKMLADKAGEKITGEASRVPQYAAGVTFGLNHAARVVRARAASLRGKTGNP